MNTSEEKTLLGTAIEAAMAAGREILEIYQSDFSVERKEDNSPLTLADKRAHKVISGMLRPLSFPVLSEEGRQVPYAKRRSWDQLWIVDPLDGTKEFVKKNGEFTVNIAFVEKHIPVLGVIYAPVKKILYYAASGMGSFKAEIKDAFAGPDHIFASAVKLPSVNDREKFTVVASRSHFSPETTEYVNKLRLEHGEIEYAFTGSSIKMCLVAEGLADEYPRFGPTMEWDTAAGQAIAEQAGKQLIDWQTQKPMRYNKENLRNNWFVVK